MRYHPFLCVCMLMILQHSAGAGEDPEVGIIPHFGVLYPWFVNMLGIIVFFMSTRYAFQIFPYTAVLFLLGVFMGIGVNRLAENDDQLSMSIRIWEEINAEVLLLVFLPGLIFFDAYSLNVHLFQVSILQCVIMAFPMVLAGTVLTACVAFYIFPYGWSWNLSMTLGSILSATDPVAVSALMDEVGAPPRLKMHISGESLLNDGAAIVFFTIFSGLFLSELGVEGLGREISVGEGFLMFFRMSIGGALIGIAFGFALVGIVFLLYRRLSHEENVMQVASTVTIAYLCYYVADSIAETSGVIAVVFCGTVFKAFGDSMINDPELMESFWSLVEHLLNTVLFSLGGTVWGSILANRVPREFSLVDWGYLVLFYLLLTVIRFVLMGTFYPLLSRIGLKSSVNEAVFLGYGGLRGAVGISLAIALDEEIFRATDDPDARRYSSQLFGMVGGIAFFTLFINGSTAGMVLKKLGLTKHSKVRDTLLDVYHSKLKDKILDAFVFLLSDSLLSSDIDFALVRHHVPYLQDLDPERLKAAVLKNRERVPKSKWQKPDLQNVIPYLMKGSEQPEFDMTWVKELSEYEENECKPCRTSLLVSKEIQEANMEELQNIHGHTAEVKELRLIFLEMLRAAYNKQIEQGYLDTRAGGSPGFVAFMLFQGIEFSIDGANYGRPLEDWDASFLIKRNLADRGKLAFDRVKRPVNFTLGNNKAKVEKSNQQMIVDASRALSFVEAHKIARKYFEDDFCSEDKINDCEKLILKESFSETEKARKVLSSFRKEDLKNVISHVFCLVLLNKASRSVERFARTGLLNQKEANEKIDEIEERIEDLRSCQTVHHPGQLSQSEKDEAMTKWTK